jgi:hypothetical protein
VNPSKSIPNKKAIGTVKSKRKKTDNAAAELPLSASLRWKHL